MIQIPEISKKLLIFIVTKKKREEGGRGIDSKGI
jgi:hypothetical protein